MIWIFPYRPTLNPSSFSAVIDLVLHGIELGYRFFFQNV